MHLSFDRDFIGEESIFDELLRDRGGTTDTPSDLSVGHIADTNTYETHDIDTRILEKSLILDTYHRIYSILGDLCVWYIGTLSILEYTVYLIAIFVIDDTTLTEELTMFESFDRRYSLHEVYPSATYHNKSSSHEGDEEFFPWEATRFFWCMMDWISLVEGDMFEC